MFKKATTLFLAFATVIPTMILGWEAKPANEKGFFTLEDDGKILEITPTFRNNKYKTLQLTKADDNYSINGIDNQSQLDFKQNIANLGDGKTQITWEYTRTSDGDLESGYISIKLPVRYWKGEAISFAGKSLQLPPEFVVKQVNLAKQNGKEIQIGAGEEKVKLELSKACYMELYDLREWKTPAYEIRIYLGGKAADFRKTAQKLILTISKTKPFIHNDGKVTTKEVHPVKSDWTSFSIDWEDKATPVWDFTASFDAPAGKYGFAKVEGPYFKFDNGKRLRMWGVNVASSANFPPKEEAAKVVGYLKRIGVNAVRFAHLDSSWYKSLINYGDREKLSYHDDNFDRFFYFLNELRNAGIYYVLDGRHGFEFKTREFDYLGSFWRYRGCNFPLYFSRHMQNYHEQYLRKLLLTENPYSGLALVDDPAFAGLQMLNETFLMRNTDKIKTIDDLPKELHGEFISKWNDWSPTVAKNKPENFNDSTIEMRREFFSDLERAYFQKMYKFYREELRVKAPIATTSCYIGFAALPSAADGDYTEGHSYYSLPTDEDLFSSDEVQVVGKKMRMSKIDVRSGYQDNNHLKWLPFSLQQRIGYQPYVMGEWNHVHPYPERFDGPLWMALLSNIQDFDGMFLFTIAHSPWETIRERNCDVLIGFEDPSTIINMIPAALIWHNAQIKPAKKVIEVTIPAADVYGKDNESYMLYGENSLSARMYNVPDVKGMRHVDNPDMVLNNHQRVATENPDLKKECDNSSPVKVYNGYVTVDAPEFTSIFGEVGLCELKAGIMTLKGNDGDEYSVSLNSLDNKPIKDSDKVLISVCPVSLAQGSTFIERIDNETGKLLRRWMYERKRNNPKVKPFGGKLTLKGDWNVYQVSNAGAKGRLLTSSKDNKTSISLGGKDPIFFYLLERKK